ncbi:MAG: response regulator transcription factor [Anaerolineae bacterium]|nr:response regulator transcription factor [Anaerolineae bacterium]
MATILLVEDDKIVRETLAYNLRQEGYDVLTAGDGRKALEIIRRDKPDLIVLDVMLPGMDGLSVCRAVRDNVETAHIPVIMLTACGEPDDKLFGLDSGADDYITKPFGLVEFRARVRAVLRRVDVRPASRDQIRAGTVMVDLAARRAYRDGRDLQLSQKEFDLLAELMCNQGTEISFKLLLSRVWGHDFSSDAHILDLHIHQLREKIEDDPSHPRYIVTVSGVGYCFEPG